MSLEGLEAELGDGAVLDGHEAKLARSVGADPAALRLHTGPAAARVSAEHRAVAFAAGNHVVMGSGAPAPGTPEGDALLLHEAAHVAQQQDAARDPGQRGTPIGGEDPAAERDAHGAALNARFGGGARDVMRTGIQIQRGGPQMAGAGMDLARYHAIEHRLRNLVAQKRELVDGTATGDKAAIDAEIDQLAGELRVDFGVSLDQGKILGAAVRGKDMLVVSGRIVLSPSGRHYMGERLGARLEIDHVPPGEILQIGWRWRTPGASQTYRFLGNGPAFAEKTRSRQLELDAPFWGLVPPAIEKAQGMEIVAELYLGDTDRPATTLSTGFIAMPERPIGHLQIVGAPDRVVQHSYLDLGIGPWTPDYRRYSIDWFVDDVPVATDQLGLRHTYEALGKHTTRADVYRVRRSFGIRDKQFVRSATTTFEVVTDEHYGDRFLTELETSPLRPRPTGIQDLLASGDRSLVEIQHRIDQGGSQKTYWEGRQKAQKARLASIRKLAPDHASDRPLPADPTRLEPGPYSGPIPAALVMSSGGGAQPLTLHLTIHDAGGLWSARLIDSTSKKVVKADGAGRTPLAAYTAAFETWRTDNEYPTGGHVVHRFAPPGWTLGTSFSTTTSWKQAKDWVDGILQVGGFLVGALLLADPDPTISKLLGGVLVAAAVARSSVAIYERIRSGGDVLSAENILDGVAILTAFFGLGGGVLRNAGIKAVSPTTYRLGNWLIMSAVAGDSGTFLYASADAIAALKSIQADPTLDDGQKSAEVLRIMSSLFVTGALLLASNRDLVRSGLKPSDFVKSDLQPGMKPELDVGARLDAEYELKQAGQWTQQTSKLSDEVVLDQLFTHRSRHELEASLASKVGARPAAALADALGNDAFVQLHHALGEGAMAALARDIGATRAGELHKSLGTSDFGALVNELGVPGAKRLTDRLSATQVKKLVDGISTRALRNLAGGSAGLGGEEIAVLVKGHGSHAVRWAGDTLDGASARTLLGSVKPKTLEGLQDVSAAEARKLIEVFGKAIVEAAVPPVTGKQLDTELLQLGAKTAKGIAEQKVGRGKVGDLARHADQLAAATAAPPTALLTGSVVLDTNMFNAIRELMEGTSWSTLGPHKKFGINQLRRTARPPLPPLTGDPSSRDMESIIGRGHDLRATNNTLGETFPTAGLDRHGFEITISRDSAQYGRVLDELARGPAPIGSRKGHGDRSIIADAVFAKGQAKPKLMTADTAMFSRLFERYGPRPTLPIKQNRHQSVAAAIAERYPDGFDVTIPDGDGGKRVIIIIPVAS